MGVSQIQNQSADPAMTFQSVRDGYARANSRRQDWESLWQDCYNYALPQRGSFSSSRRGNGLNSDIYDATAMDAVDQLAASLLGHLTPPWGQWFGLRPGPDVEEGDREALASVLEKAGKTMQAHFDRSNFAVEVHQCFLDLVVGGTATLLFEEAQPGEMTAYKFTSVPLRETVFEEGTSGFLDNIYRRFTLNVSQIKARFPFVELPFEIEENADTKWTVLERVAPESTGAYEYSAVLEDKETVLSKVRLGRSPFISFRWMKSPGEIYGRSPVMKALPDIKTANKVVELILKNASIAIAGIWQADDDGVLNPANIELVPGAIIPKAVGSKGLTPLDMPARFDVSQLVLEDLHNRIRHALLADKMPQIGSRQMTATEVLERSAEMSLILGATYGRLQSELLTPLIQRGFEILRRRGEVPDIRLDGRMVEIDYRSPLARSQGQSHVQNTLSWVNTVLAMGSEAAATVNFAQTSKYLGDALGVPSDLIRTQMPAETVLTDIVQAIDATGGTDAVF